MLHYEEAKQPQKKEEQFEGTASKRQELPCKHSLTFPAAQVTAAVGSSQLPHLSYHTHICPVSTNLHPKLELRVV